MLGEIDRDPESPTRSNERSPLRMPAPGRDLVRNRLVRVQAPDACFLGRIVSGPFFPEGDGGFVFGEVELMGELRGSFVGDTNRRPPPGSTVHALTPQEIAPLLGCTGELVLGSLLGQDVHVALRGHDKGVLPRNLGIFGTVGSGKSNTAQVLIEEAARSGWAVIVVDVEGEYTALDVPGEPEVAGLLARYDRAPGGVPDFAVHYLKSCPGERGDGLPFTLRLADFEAPVIAELLETTLPERNALFECIDHFLSKSRAKMTLNDREELATLLDPSPDVKPPFSLYMLKEKAVERSSRGNEHIDFVGVAAKLSRLMHAGAFDEPRVRGLDVEAMIEPGRVSVLDVSAAGEVVQNLVTAALLRKSFAYKLLHQDAAPTLLVIEEAHSFIRKDRAASMHATLQMLRTVTRRGRKRWLALCFVSQQPGHLPAEIFELCNTRVVHNLRSLHNLEALMATAGDVSQQLWAHCPLLGPGEALLSSPQLRRPVVIKVRPGCSRRRFTR